MQRHAGEETGGFGENGGDVSRFDSSYEKASQVRWLFDFLTNFNKGLHAVFARNFLLLVPKESDASAHLYERV